ncbi:MAG: hypothetical protein NVS9B14_06750 [Candidatus Acidiferrum sp.]
MSFAGSIDAPVEIIGGLVCDMAASELPSGVSPDCQDVMFAESSVRTRPGLTSIYAALAGNPTVNYVKSFVKLDGTIRTMVYSSAGDLWEEQSVGVLTAVQAGVGLQSPYPLSTTMFGREYFAFGDGKVGQDLPRQWDDTNFDEVAQEGPGAPPTAADENTSAAISGITQPAAVTIAASPNGATQVGFLVTITTTAAHGLSANDVTTIAGVTVAGYNATVTVRSVLSATQFTYVAATSGLAASGAGTSSSATSTVTTGTAHGLTAGQLVVIANASVATYNGTFAVVTAPTTTTFTYRAGTGGLAAGGAAGTIGSAGSIIAGVHGIAVAFITRNGYITPASPTGSWTAAGGRRVVVSGIPIGPPNVVGRILLFTGSGQATYFYIPSQATTLFSGATVINDNTTTTASFDFTDAILLAATSGSGLFSQIRLPEQAGVIEYKQRLFWWGERRRQSNWVNLDFNGGFVNGNTAGASDNTPLGWTADPTFGPGKTDEEAFTVFGCAYVVVGNGTTPTRGQITQSAVQDYLGVPRLQANVGYSIRARLARNNTLAQGTIHIHLFSATGGINTTGIAITAAQANNTKYVEYTAVLTAPLTSIPSDLVLRIYADGTPTNNGKFYVDNIEIYPTAKAQNASLVRASVAGGPEQYDGVTGFFQVAENNGQATRAAFRLRDRLYFLKYGKNSGSLHETEDNGTTEPNGWTVSEISSRVGTPSARGVAVGQDWAIIAARDGLYITNGGEPQKISQEIGHSTSGLTLAWDQINWQYGHTIWVVVDTQERRILVGAPFGAANSPNYILQLDYRDVSPDSADAIAQAPPVTISYRGIKIVRDKSRKWSPWTISANHGAIVERFDGTQQVFLGCGAFAGNAPLVSPTGKVYQLDATKLTDDGAAIPSYYVTAFIPQRETEQMLQLHAHRKLFTYLTLYCEGAGAITLTAYAASETAGQALPNLRLTSPAVKDIEATINVLAERVAFKVASDTSVAGNWFRLQKLTPSLAGDPWSPVRGQN